MFLHTNLFYFSRVRIYKMDWFYANKFQSLSFIALFLLFRFLFCCLRGRFFYCLFCCLVERVLYTGYKFFLGIQFTNSSSYSVDCYFLYGIICTTEVFNFEVQVIYLFSFVASSFNFIFASSKSRHTFYH